jgi:hypothetical protein
MINRRHALRLAAAALPALGVVCAAAAYAQQAFQRFVPFLIDLDGWQGNKPDGMAMEMTNATMITATRHYQRSPAHLEASIIIGTAAQAALAAVQTGMKIETTDGRLGTSSINGFQVIQTYTISQKSGAILVALGPAAMFNLAFNGVTDQDALALAEKFDWKGIQAALPK